MAMGEGGGGKGSTVTAVTMGPIDAGAGLVIDVLQAKAGSSQSINSSFFMFRTPVR